MSVQEHSCHFPATLVVFPEGYGARRAAFYLAAEEYVAGLVSNDRCRGAERQSYLFTWILAPTVVFGRNQVVRNEIDVDFCRRHNIDVVRRKSGGGAIYADGGNIMTSLITEGGPIEPLFQEYSEKVAAMLSSFGAPAIATGRNDIVVQQDGGRVSGKVCGNAFYHLPLSNIVHGTMLYDTDFDLMMGALLPPTEKLKRHGVESVRQRVTLLKDYLSFDVNVLRKGIETSLTSGTLMLTQEDISQIEDMEQLYYREVF